MTAFGPEAEWQVLVIDLSESGRISAMIGMTESDPEPVVQVRQIERLVSPEAAITLSRSAIGHDHDR